MNVGASQRRVVTDYMDAVTSIAFLEVVIGLEHFPMLSLTWHDYSRASAQGANALQGCDYRCPYEFGSVRNAFHSVP